LELIPLWGHGRCEEGRGGCVLRSRLML